jgi:predicted HTH transcriptional regulator
MQKYCLNAGLPEPIFEENQEICNTSERTSSRDMAELVSSGLFEQIGITGKGTAYILRRQRRHNKY